MCCYRHVVMGMASDGVGLLAGRFRRRLSGPFGTRAGRTTPAAMTETLAVTRIDVAFAGSGWLLLGATGNKGREAVNLIAFGRLRGRLRLRSAGVATDRISRNHRQLRWRGC